MSIDSIRNTFLNLKDLTSIGFFAVMMNFGWVYLFIISPAFVAMMALFSLTMVGLSIVQIKKFFESSNTNIEGILKTLLGGSNLILLGIVATTVLIFSIVALVLAIGLGSVVFAGFALINAPYLLLVSTSLTLITQGVLLGLNLLRWYESPFNSPQRSHYVQASFSALFDTLTAAVILSAVVALLFFPFVPFVLPVLASSSILLTVANGAWRFTSTDSKTWFKSIFGIEKPLIEDNVCTVLKRPNVSLLPQLIIADRGHRLFTAPDHLSTIKGIFGKEWQKEYLLKIIDQKLAGYTNAPQSEKNISKSVLLSQIKSQLNSDKELTLIDKKKAATEQPHVFNSFWREKGEIEAITDAFNWFCNNKQPEATIDFRVK